MRQFAALFLAALTTTALSAETRCPANVRAIPFRNVNQHQMIVGVSVNHSGPYEFLLDTGTQMTVVDRSLAAELHIPTTGNANVAGVSFQGRAMFAQLDTLEIGDHVASHQGVLIYSMKTLQAAGFAIRGLLGEDFLSRFDVLIDNANHVLCMDDTGAMRDGMTGAQGALAPFGGPVHDLERNELPLHSDRGSVGCGPTVGVDSGTSSRSGLEALPACPGPEWNGTQVSLLTREAVHLRA
jgi:hypothetical protein